ncbi:MAG TPA: hypothetical protein VMT16_10955 [Thermoanaerobaculia bacterium]|nr:hypothetical protein [Thermoanaerobaculia bacterium]
MAEKRAPLVGVVGTGRDVRGLLGDVLEDEGYETVCLAAERGELPVDQILVFVADHDPDVIVFDLASPFRDNWFALERLQRARVMRGRRLLVTTPDWGLAQELLCDQQVWEIAGRRRSELRGFLRAVHDLCPPPPLPQRVIPFARA